MPAQKAESQPSQTHPDRQRFIQNADNASETAHTTHARQLKSKARKRKQMAEEGPELSDKKIGEQKKRIRDLARALEHKEKMPMTLRQAKERELEAVRGDLEEALRNKEKNRLIKQYHMVRFFERQKATRALKHAQKAAAAEPAGSSSREALEVQVHKAEVDLNYTMFSPLLQRYAGIYGKEGRRSDFEPKNWKLVEEAMANNTLKDLRNSMSEKDRKALDKASGIQKYNKLVDRARQHTKASVQQEGDDDDGEDGDGATSGGFFEYG